MREWHGSEGVAWKGGSGMEGCHTRGEAGCTRAVSDSKTRTCGSQPGRRGGVVTGRDRSLTRMRAGGGVGAEKGSVAWGSWRAVVCKEYLIHLMLKQPDEIDWSTAHQWRPAEVPTRPE